MTWIILFLLIGPAIVWLVMEIKYRRQCNATYTVKYKDHCWEVCKQNGTVFKHIDKHVVKEWLDQHG